MLNKESEKLIALQKIIKALEIQNQLKQCKLNPEKSIAHGFVKILSK
jgi:hypothetical protein